MGIIKITKSSVVFLCPCLVSALVFLLYWTPRGEPPCPIGVVYKCLPILFLCMYVGAEIFFSGISRYSACIMLGLLFSGTGDAYMVYQRDYFIHGMLAFGAAHLFYAVAFHERRMWWKFVVFYTPFNVVMFTILAPRVSFQVFVPGCFYGLLITLMLWRAAARLDFSNPSASKLCALAGALLFLASDTVLSLNKFAVPLPYAQYIIMTTYYSSQFLITVSVHKEVEKHGVTAALNDGLKKNN
ncbi:lysoplasmalogenase-like protein TMEM86A isoform X3 [Acanthaster planci]|uniref:lysoplasmalogenase n=1 Tax=Acanthaster planci TaxID=133434 RepID=A0A8B7XSC5_ACAPL|nr:lysoplasmalogenase-like protein TMEM86A isoform X3 [Acanthaster planci]